MPAITKVMFCSSDSFFLLFHSHREIDGANYIVFCRSLLRLIQVITLPVFKCQKEGGRGGYKRCTAEALKPSPCLRQKLLILLPCKTRGPGPGFVSFCVQN